MNKLILAALVSIVGSFASTGAYAQQWEFDGEFAETRSSGGACDTVFATTDYHNRHFLTGPTRRTSVLNFKANGDGDGFFDSLNFVGLFGGSNDLYYELQVERDGVTYDILAEGLVDWSVLYLEFTVKAKDAEGHPLCEAAAQYSAFN